MEWLFDPIAGAMTESRLWNGGSEPMWRTQFDFNALGELESEMQGPSGATLTWGWSYGYAGELQKTTYPPNLGISTGEFEYDEAMRPSNAFYKVNQTALSNYVFGYQGARLQSRTEDSQTHDTRLELGYDAWGRIDTLLWGTWAGGATFQAIDGQERAFDLADRVIARRRFADTTGEVFVHDGFGRMQAWYQGVPNALGQAPNTTPTAWTGRTQYTLNDVFARLQTQVDTNGGGTSVTTYTANPAHFYTQISVPGGSTQTRVTSHGLLTDDGAHLFYYDPWDRLAEVRRKNDGVLVRRFTYDAEGRRVRTVDESGQTTRMAYWGSRLASTFLEGATRTNIYTYAYTGGADGESLVRITQASPNVNGTYHLVRDFQGSVLALALPDGTVVERYRYSPFGEVTIENQQGQPLAQSAYGFNRFFLGRPFDATIGLQDLRARWYDPKLGVFPSPDPLGPIDSWNLFQYGFGTPVTWLDPYGLNSECPYFSYEDYLTALSNHRAGSHSSPDGLLSAACDLPDEDSRAQECKECHRKASESEWEKVRGSKARKLCEFVAINNPDAFVTAVMGLLDSLGDGYDLGDALTDFGIAALLALSPIPGDEAAATANLAARIWAALQAGSRAAVRGLIREIGQGAGAQTSPRNATVRGSSRDAENLFRQLETQALNSGGRTLNPTTFQYNGINVNLHPSSSSQGAPTIEFFVHGATFKVRFTP